MSSGKVAYAVLTVRGTIAADSSGNSDKALAVYSTRKAAEAMRDADETVIKVVLFDERSVR